MFLLSNEKGLSLIEVVVSTVVLSVLIIPIFSLITMNIKVNTRSKNQIIATNLAETEIEELKNDFPIKIEKRITQYNGFVITTDVELIDRSDTFKDKEEKKINNLYKLIVEVKKEEKVIETLFTYRNSSKGLKNHEAF